MFFNNYAKPGKGVNKRKPDEPRFKIYLDVLPRKLWDLCKLNLLYLLTAIPFFLVTMLIVGVISSPITDSLMAIAGDTLDPSYYVIADVFFRFALALLFTVTLGLGPVTAAFTFIVREHGRELHCWLFSDYFERFKANFKQSILMWIIDLAALYLFSVAITFYLNSNILILAWLVCVIAVIFVMMHMYIYPIMITFDLPLKHILKNSLLFTLGKAPKNLLLFLIVIVIHIIIPYLLLRIFGNFIVVLIIALLELLILPSFTAFTTTFWIYPDMDQYINSANKTNDSQPTNE